MRFRPPARFRRGFEMSRGAEPAALALSSDLGEIDRAAAHVLAFGEAHGLDPEAVNRLTLILEELITNTVKHGGVDPVSPMKMRISSTGGRVVVAYTDRGRAFNPVRDLPPDDRDRSLEARRIGGLGWALVRHYCESVTYAREEGENRVTMVTTVTSDR